jgi:transposase
MPAAYPLFFRRKVVDAYEAGHGSFKQVGEQFGIGEATVNRWVSQESKQGHLLPKERRRRARVVTDKAVAYMKGLLEDDPAWTTQELADELVDAFEIRVTRQTIGEALRRAGLSRKRGSRDRQPPSPTAS